MPDRCPLNLDKQCPVVTTVGDLTARHASQDVRIGGGRFAFLGFDFTYGPSSFILFDGEETCVYRFALDTPCELLP